jgi:hypothetical protein
MLGIIFISRWLFTLPLIKHLPSWRRLFIFVILCEEFCTVYVFLKGEEVLRTYYKSLLYLSVLYYLLSAMTSCKLQIFAICVPSGMFVMWATWINLLSGSFLTNQMRCCLQRTQCCANPWLVQHESRYSVSCQSKFITVRSCCGDI